MSNVLSLCAYRQRRQDRLSELAVLNSKRALYLSRIALAETPSEQQRWRSGLRRIDKLRAQYLGERRALERAGGRR